MNIRIYAVADIHGKPERLALIRNIIHEARPDVLVAAGDITGYTRPAPVIEALSGMPVPVIAVRGNTDLPVVDRLIDRYPNVSNAHLKKIAVKDRCFIGMSGTVPIPFRSRIRFREKKALQKAGTLLNKTSVIVVHPPPWGTLDRVFGKFHAGSKGLLRLLDEAEPALCICGHIHEMPGSEHVGRTLVVNCSIGWRGAGSLIELSEDGAARAETIEG